MRPPKKAILNTSLVMNENGELAFFYVGSLNFTPSWASLDVEQGEICIGGTEEQLGGIKLERIKKDTYEEIKYAEKIMLVGTDDTPDRKPHEAIWVPLMVTTQIK